MADFFTPEELAAYLQADVDTATALLLRDLVTAVIEDAAGKSYAATPTAPGVLRAVALAAAARAYTNPQGVASESIDDYSYRRAGDGRGGVYLTAEERRAVRKAAVTSRIGLGTLRMTRSPRSTVFVEAIHVGQPVPAPGSDASWPVPFEDEWP